MDLRISQVKAMVKSFVQNAVTADEDAIAPSPIYMHSSPGIGKSSVVRQVAAELSKELGENIEIRDVRLASYEPSDVNGIPYVSHFGKDETMEFSTPAWFPTDPNWKGILFFDEISNATVSTQHAAYRIILDREINNGKKLPKHCQIIAAGNLKSDKTGAKNVVSALANRFSAHLYIQANVDDFLAYAVSHDFSPEVTGFMLYQPQMLYMAPKSDAEVAFPTPRTWEYVSNHLKLGLPEEQLVAAISGCIGDKAAIEFSAFRKYVGKLPNFQKIMDGKEKYKLPKNDIGLVWACTSALIDCVIHNYKSDKKLANLTSVLTQLEDDFLAAFFKSVKQGVPPEESRAVQAAMLKVFPDQFRRITPYVLDGQK